jgi:hypothetical protein
VCWLLPSLMEVRCLYSGPFWPFCSILNVKRSALEHPAFSPQGGLSLAANVVSMAVDPHVIAQ